MNPDKQRIAIAEALNWTNITFATGTLDPGQPDLFATPPGANWGRRLPWLYDLNATHELENTLTKQQQQIFLYLLHGEKVTNDTWNLVHATAAQRAEAFLRTVGKWEETP